LVASPRRRPSPSKTGWRHQDFGYLQASTSELFVAEYFWYICLFGALASVTDGS